MKYMLLATGIALTALLIWQADSQEFLTSLLMAKPEWLVAAFTLQLLTVTMISWQWKLLGHHIHSGCRFHQMVHINMSGTFFESVTPAMKTGGEVVKAYLLKRAFGWTTVQSVALVGLQKVVSIGPLLFLVGVSLSLYVIANGISTPQGWLVATSGMILLPVFLLICAVFIAPAGLAVWLEKVFPAKWVHTLSQSLHSLENALSQVKKRGSLGRHFLLSVTLWFLFPAKAAIIALSMGLEADLINIATVTFLAYMVAMIPLTPGGLGTFEATVVFLLLPLEIAMHQSMAFAIILRLVTFWLPFLISALYLLAHWGLGHARVPARTPSP